MECNAEILCSSHFYTNKDVRQYTKKDFQDTKESNHFVSFKVHLHTSAQFFPKFTSKASMSFLNDMRCLKPLALT